jgi:integrase
MVNISTDEVDRFLDFLILSGKSPATRNRYRALLHTIFKYAMRSGVCLRNPVTDIPILSERLKTRTIDYWRSQDEVDAYIRASFRYRREFGIGASILCLGGCRIGELLGLRWGDIEWERSYIRIRRIVERLTNKIFDRTKGQRAGGEYQMILVPRLRKFLEQWKLVTPRLNEEDFLIGHEDGRHFSYDYYAKGHKRILVLGKIKRITLHDIRRTFASSAERAGFHKAEIGELLGHETLTATEAYTKMDLSHLVDKAKKVGFGK